jgi:transcriptional regulator with XRE-family HTH domain
MKKKTNGKSVKANVAFGDALRRLRTQAGVSQERLAEMSGIHRNHVGDIERGDKEVCLLTMLRICHALRVPLSTLAQEMEHPSRLAPAKKPSGNDPGHGSRTIRNEREMGQRQIN